MVECYVCGTFAIGKCVKCSRAVCGQHGVMRHDRLLCQEDVLKEQLAEKAAADSQRQQIAIQNAQAVASEASKKLDAKLAALRQFANSGERFIEAIAQRPELLNLATTADSAPNKNAVPAVHAQVLEQAYRQMFADGGFPKFSRGVELAPSEWKYETQGVIEWLVERSLLGPARKARLYEARVNGGRKRGRRYRGWFLRSITESFSVGQYGSSSMTLDVILFETGEIANIPRGASKVQPWQRNKGSIQETAVLINIVRRR